MDTRPLDGPPGPPPPRTRLPRGFEPAGAVHRGAQADVHRARKARGAGGAGGGDYAMKVFHGTDGATVARAQEELRLLEELRDHAHRSPRWPVLEDHALNEDRQVCLWYPWIEGEGLTELADREALPLAGRLRLAAEAARALAALHQAGLVHRDVKPSNFVARRQDGGFSWLSRTSGSRSGRTRPAPSAGRTRSSSW